MDAYQYCEDLVRTVDKDRYLAGLFAPARRHLFALYAFAIEIARIADVVREPLAGEIRLQWWREVIAGKRNEAAGNPVAAALLDTISARALNAEPLLQLIDAHGRDLYGDAMARLAELDACAEHKVGVLFAVGAIILLGAGHPQIKSIDAPKAKSAGAPKVGPDGASEFVTSEAARYAGIASYVAERIADFPQDVARGRIFLPDDILAQHGLSRAEIEPGYDSAGLRAALGQVCEHARGALAAFSRTAPALP